MPEGPIEPPVDRTVGENLRRKLVFSGHSEADLAKSLSDATGQNIQEKDIKDFQDGKKRIPPMVFQEILRILGGSVTDYFLNGPEVVPGNDNGPEK